MIYLDNAATTYPKPQLVINNLRRAAERYGGNPGRSGHKMSVETSEAVLEARIKCAEFFGAEPQNTVFMPNCTAALNTAIKGIAHSGSHIITTDIEHNAVLRPIYSLAASSGVTYSVAKTFDDDDATAASIEKLISKRTVAVVCTAASNVTGKILPYRKIGELCRRRGVCFILDAAQGGGVLPISLSDGINIICAAGHKSLYGPMGTGLMITDGKYRMSTLIEGGTGTNSSELVQPEALPERFESGTINTAGVIALGYGIDFVNSKGIDNIYRHEMELCRLFRSLASKIDGVILYGDSIDGKSVPIVLFNIAGMPSETLAYKLSEHGVYMRGGYHCAYYSHRKAGTAKHGAVRFTPSVFTTYGDIRQTVSVLALIAK